MWPTGCLRTRHRAIDISECKMHSDNSNSKCTIDLLYINTKQEIKPPFGIQFKCHPTEISRTLTSARQWPKETPSRLRCCPAHSKIDAFNYQWPLLHASWQTQQTILKKRSHIRKLTLPPNVQLLNYTWSLPITSSDYYLRSATETPRTKVLIREILLWLTIWTAAKAAMSSSGTHA